VVIDIRAQSYTGLPDIPLPLRIRIRYLTVIFNPMVNYPHLQLHLFEFLDLVQDLEGLLKFKEIGSLILLFSQLLNQRKNLFNGNIFSDPCQKVQ